MNVSTRLVKWCFEVSFETRRESKIEFPVAYRKCTEERVRGLRFAGSLAAFSVPSLKNEPIQGAPDPWTKPCKSDMFKKLFRKLSGSKRTKLPHLLEGSELDPFFTELDYFPRPEWSQITEYIESKPEEERGLAWQDFAYHWLHRLAAHLGGSGVRLW